VEKNNLIQPQVKDTPITKGGSLLLNVAFITTEGIANSSTKRRIPPPVAARWIPWQSSLKLALTNSQLNAFLEDVDIYSIRDTIQHIEHDISLLKTSASS